ncbi:uncharacterized protein V6R79_023694 [Siganus canaliculatus]
MKDLWRSRADRQDGVILDEALLNKKKTRPDEFKSKATAENILNRSSKPARVQRRRANGGSVPGRLASVTLIPSNVSESATSTSADHRTLRRQPPAFDVLRRVSSAAAAVNHGWICAFKEFEILMFGSVCVQL